MLGDTAQWITIIGGTVVIGGSLIGAAFWMFAMYFNGKATAASVKKMENSLGSVWKWVRRKHRKSDLFHVNTTNKLKDHERRLHILEGRNGEET